MKEYKIFTDAELKVLQDRIERKGNVDKTGIFYSRIRPKGLEIFEWFKRKKTCKKQ